MAVLQSSSRPSSGEAGPVLRAVLEAKAATARAVRGKALQATVDALVTQGRLLGATHLFGASEIGHALAGAMVYTAPDMEIWTPGSPVEHVLLIDGAVASQAGPRWHIEIALATGAERADALVLSAPDVVDHPSASANENGRIVTMPRLSVAA